MTALVVDASGRVRAVYSEAVDFELLGQVAIKRASHVEPDEGGRWWADLSPVDGQSSARSRFAPRPFRLNSAG